MSGYVFVSYSHVDRTYVEKLAAYLASAGVPVWYDYETATGDRFARVVEQRIDGCAAFVVVMTPASMASKWVDREIHHADAIGKPVLPLMLTTCRPSMLINNLNHEDVTGGQLPSHIVVSR